MSPATVKFPLVSNLNNVVEPFLITKSAPLNSKFQSFDAWSIESEFAFKFASTSTAPKKLVTPAFVILITLPLVATTPSAVDVPKPISKLPEVLVDVAQKFVVEWSVFC